VCGGAEAVVREVGSTALPVNFGVTTNAGAVALWHKLGFEAVGRLPRAFRHPEAGLVDALVMYKWLDGSDEIEPRS